MPSVILIIIIILIVRWPRRPSSRPIEWLDDGAALISELADLSRDAFGATLLGPK